MKKKLNISVVDIVNRASSPKNRKNINEHKPIPSPTNSVIIVDKPMRFQDLYKKLINDSNQNGDIGCQKIIYQSKKSTPINTNRTKKLSINRSTNNSKSRSNSNAGSARKPVCSFNGSQRVHQNNKQNIKQNIMADDPTTNNLKESKNQNLKISQLYQNISEFQRCVSQLNHEQHSHLRERNDCFLSEKEIDHIMMQLGYNIKNNKYSSFLSLLQVDIYGGVPSQNLKKILQVIQRPYLLEQNDQAIKLPKVIDNNLKLTLNKQKQNIIYNYFRDFCLLRCDKFDQKKMDTSIVYRPPLNSLQSSVQLIKQKQKNYQTYDTQQKMQLSSPNKKVSSPAISQLIQALSQSQKKKSASKQLNKQQMDTKNNIIQEILQQNMNTFRKLEATGFQPDGNEYNFSRQLSGDNLLQTKQDEDIVQLKNRLNQALKKSSQQANQYFGKDKQYNSFIYSNPLKYGSKPILSVDVNLGDGISQKIIVYQGESAKQVSDRLAAKFTISEETKTKFEKMLQSHLSTMLWKIDELSEQQKVTDRDPSD